MTGIAIRSARVDEGERLRAVRHDARAHWGYDTALVTRWVDGEDFGGQRFACDGIVVAERMGAAVVGETETTWERSIPVMQLELDP